MAGGSQEVSGCPTDPPLTAHHHDPAIKRQNLDFLMHRSEYVVNIVAHVNHGKTTVMDNVLEHAGVLSRSMAGEARLLDSRKDEIERGITMKISPVSVLVKDAKITFLDTPGHLEFSSLTVSTFVVCDISVIVVDVLSGVTERLKGLVRRAEEGGASIVLFINKVDLLFSKHTAPDSIGHQIEKIVQDVQSVARTEIGWAQGTILVGSAKDNWAISGLSDAGPLLKKPGAAALSLKQTVGLLSQVHGSSEVQKAVLYERAGLGQPEKGRARQFPKDLLARVFGFFGALHGAVLAARLPASCYSAELASVPEEVVGVVCSNTLVGETVTAVVRTVKNRVVALNDALVVQEPEGAVTAGTVEKLVLFLQREMSLERGAGLVGVQGLNCQKRGVVVTRVTEQTTRFLESLAWAEFCPVFTDVILPAPGAFAEVARRMALLSRCEPGIYCQLTERQEIVVQSDGELQLDKIKADLEGLPFTTREKSERYMETVESGEGVVQSRNSRWVVSFAGLPLSGEAVAVPPGAEQMFGRGCYVRCAEETPGEIVRGISSLLQQGPYLHELCDRMVVSVRPLLDGGEVGADPNGVNSAVPQSLAKIYLQAGPRVLTTYTELTVSIPSEHMKKASIAASKAHAKVRGTEHTEESAELRISMPVRELREFIKELRTLSRGECDVFLDKTVRFAVPDSRMYEDALAERIRDEKGILQKERIVEG